MKLKDLLREHKERILKKWFDVVVKTSPDETAKFLLREKDPFNNPVGSNIKEGIEVVLDQLLCGQRIEAVNPFVERLVKIRAIQDFLPSQAVAFVFALKVIIREVGGVEPGKEADHELVDLDRRIDSFALLVFDCYMQSREKVSEIRINEVKNRVSRLLKRANLLAELDEDGEGEDTPH